MIPFLSTLRANLSRPFRRPVPKGKLAAPALADLRIPEPRNIAELAERMRQDYQVQLAEMVLVANLKSARVSMSVSGGDTRATLLAERLQELWRATLASMAACIGDGRVAYEKLWEYDPVADLTRIRKLEPL